MAVRWFNHPEAAGDLLSDTGLYPDTLYGDMTSGNAAVLYVGEDLSGYPAGSKVTITDLIGREAVGYIKGADDAVSYGSNLITNGDFNSDVTGWSESEIGGTGTLSWDSGQAKCTIDSGQNVGIYQSAISVTPSAVYQVLFDYDKSGMTTYGAIITNILQRNTEYGSGDADTDTDVEQILGAGTVGSTSVYFKDANDGDVSGEYFKIDNVRLRRMTSFGTTAIQIVDAPGSTTRDWESIDASFANNLLNGITIEPEDIGAVRYWNAGNVKWWGNTYLKKEGLSWMIKDEKAFDSDWWIKNTASIDHDWLILTSGNFNSDWRIFNVDGLDIDWLILTQAELDFDWRIKTITGLDSDWLILTTAGLDFDWMVKDDGSIYFDWLIQTTASIDFNWKLPAGIQMSWHIITDPSEPKTIHHALVVKMAHTAEPFDFTQLAKPGMFTHAVNKIKDFSMGVPTKALSTHKAKPEGFSHTAKALQRVHMALRKTKMRF